MPLFNDETTTTQGADVSASEGVLIYGADSGSIARKLKTGVDGAVIVTPGDSFVTQFGQTRVALPYTLADNINKYGFDGFEFASASVGGGTITSVTSQSALSLAVAATSADAARIRSNTFFRYQAGKQQVIKLSCYIPGGGKTNQISRWGYFDDNNGLFFALSGSSFGIYRRNFAIGGAVTDTFISQSAFNVDKFDGTGITGINLDLTKTNLFEIRFQWLGVGNAEFFINNELVHELINPNTLAGPYMQTAVLPVAAEIVNTGTSTANEFNFICSAVESEGGQPPPKFTFGAYNATDISTTTTERPLLLIRPGTLFRSLENRIVGIPKLVVVSTEGSRAGFRIILNPATLTGGTWTSASLNNSAFEYNNGATAFTGGETIYRGFLPNTNDAREVNLTDFFEINGRGLRLNGFATGVDTLLITGVNESAGTTLMRASIVWQEIR